MKIVNSPLRALTHGIFVFLLVPLIFSCSNKSELANHIPKDANVVVAFDIKKMGLKSLKLEEIFTVDNIKKALGSLGEKDTTSNFANSGIDFLNKAYFFMKTAENGQHYGAVIAALSDSKKFENFIKESAKDIKVKEEGGFKMASFEEGKNIICWNQNELILLYGGENPKEKILTLANLKKDESLISASKTFSELENESADISVWVNFESLEKLASQYSPATSGVSLKETFLAATCNFEDGQIVIDSKYTANKEMADKLNFVKGNVSPEVVNVLPGNSVIAMLGFALDMDKMFSYLEQEKVLDAYSASATQLTGLTVKEFFTMLSGDVGVTLNGVEMKEVKTVNWMTGEEVTNNVPEANYCAVIGVANKETVSKFLGHLETNGMLAKTDNYYSFQNKLFVIDNGSSLIITGTESTKQSALGGNAEKLNEELKSLLTSNATSVYLNLKNIPETVFSTANPLVGSNIKNSEVEDIIITGSTVQNNVTSGKIVIRFKEKNENSLVTLTRISKKYAELIQEMTVAANTKPVETPVLPN
jgi:hypothetical protein